MLPRRSRGGKESEIKRTLSRLNKQKRKELIRLLGDPPDTRNVPAAFWKTLEDDTTLLLLLLLLATHEQASDRLESAVGQRLDPEERLQAATTFAEDRARRVGVGVAKSTKDRLASAVTKLNAGKIKSLNETQMRKVIGNQQAEDISITETTNANATGEMDAVNKIRAGKAPPTLDNGPLDKAPDIIATWITARDGKVCTICEPLDLKPESFWGRFFPDGPPGHPRCRCDIDYQADGRSVIPRKGSPPDNLTISEAVTLMAEKGYNLRGGAGFSRRGPDALYQVKTPDGRLVTMSSADIKRIIR